MKAEINEKKGHSDNLLRYKTQEKAEIHIYEQKSISESCYVCRMLIFYATRAHKSWKSQEINRDTVEMGGLNMYSMQSFSVQKSFCTTQYL